MTTLDPMPPQADFCGLVIPDQPPDDETTTTTMPDEADA